MKAGRWEGGCWECNTWPQPRSPPDAASKQSWRSAQTREQGGRDVAGEREELGDRKVGQGGAAAAASGWAMGRLIAAVSGQPRGSLHLPREVPYRLRMRRCQGAR